MNWLILLILFFLGVSLLLYVLLGGADFGAGILELTLPNHRQKDHTTEQRTLISHAMAPVWEANHMWLVLAIVILFMGFPPLYSTITTYLHIPVMAVLIGIVARGCAFTFRHYDINSEYYWSYSKVFAWSSLWTSFFLGIIAGAITLGNIHSEALDFYTLYVGPWWNGFCVAMGIFTSSLFTFLTAVYLTGETNDLKLRRSFQYRAGIANIVLVIAGAWVFIRAELEGILLTRTFLYNRLSVFCFILATFLLWPFWYKLRQGRNTLIIRIAAIALVTLVLVGWYAIQYPIAIRMIGANGEPLVLSFVEAAAPPQTLRVLLWALLVGSGMIFPALAYLLTIFKRSSR